MRVLVVAPGPRFSTYDTFTYYHDAFINLGHETFAFKYHDHFGYHATALSLMEDKTGEEYELQMRAIGLSAESLISRVARVKPDLIFIVSGLALPIGVWDWLDTFKDSLKNPFRTMILFTESPYIDESQFPLIDRVDYAATTDKASLPAFREINERSMYIQHAHNPVVHKMWPASRAHQADVFMVGTGFPERILLMSQVDWEGIDLRIFGGNWGDLPESTLLDGHYSLDFISNSEQVVQWYSNSKICPNMFRTAKWPGENVLHVSPGDGYSISPRCYEIMGCGGFLLTDTRPELLELFKEGKDFVAFEGPEDLEDKIRYYLVHDRERRKIALSGRSAVRGHTYEDRAKKIIEFVSNV